MEVRSSLNMKAKKALGQNFLIDDKVINNICSSINATNNDLIIEIGPGKGALTKLLKQKDANLIAYEIDTDLIPNLKKLENNKTIIVNKDILLTNFKNEISNCNYNNLYIVGNLPYYITTPIIKHIIDLQMDVKEMVFMVQDEVSDRFTSDINHKEYGSMTLYLKYYFYVEKLFVVNKNSFSPVPKVESAVIKLTKREKKLEVDEAKYFKLIHDAFTQKRKTLKNNLNNYDWNIIKKILIKNNLNESVRAEQVSENVFAEICNSI